MFQIVEHISWCHCYILITTETEIKCLIKYEGKFIYVTRIKRPLYNKTIMYNNNILQYSFIFLCHFTFFLLFYTLYSRCTRMWEDCYMLGVVPLPLVRSFFQYFINFINTPVFMCLHVDRLSRFIRDICLSSSASIWSVSTETR